MKYRIGDNVMVTAGDNVGKTGAITKILQSQNRVVVEGINKKIRHVKGREGNPGERTEFFAPIHISNIAVVGKDGKPSRIGFQKEKGEKVRIIKRTGELVEGSTKAKKIKNAKKEEGKTEPIKA